MSTAATSDYEQIDARRRLVDSHGLSVPHVLVQRIKVCLTLSLKADL